MSKKIELSIVIPCYQEEDGIKELVKRVSAAAEKTALPYELILVDDGSSDATWQCMVGSLAGNSSIRAVKLARNHGHQLALSAGLSLVQAEQYVFVLDADLQDPPELLSGMLETMKNENADVVYGKRKKRNGETVFKRLTAGAFYRFLRIMTDIDIPADTGDFRLMKRHVVDTLCSMPEHARFIRGMVSWIGGRQVPYLYSRDCRFAGSTKYHLRKMTNFALDAITSFSIKPLRIGLKLGFLGVFCGSLLLVYSLCSYFFFKTTAGWTSLIAVVIVMGSLQLFLLGLIGEYIGRIFVDTQKRPLFLIKEIREKEDKNVE